jgi:hypothetical protein
MRLRYRFVTFTLIAALCGSLTGCGGEDDPQTKPSPRTTTSTNDPSPSKDPSEAGGPPSGWEEKFTRGQVNRYNAALRRWEQYTKLSNEIYRKGKNTPEARNTLQEFSLFWQRDVVTLARDFDKGGIREEVPPEPLWTYATSIEASQVAMIQCTDYSDARITKNGDVLDNKPKHLVTPLIVRMTKTTDGDWKFRSTTLKDKASCAA